MARAASVLAAIAALVALAPDCQAAWPLDDRTVRLAFVLPEATVGPLDVVVRDLHGREATLPHAVRPIPRDSSIAFVDVGRSERGRVILYGNVLPDTTFHVRIRVTVSGRDTLWNGGLYINGIPLRTRRPPPPIPSAAQMNRLDFMREAGARTRAIRDERLLAGHPVSRSEFFQLLQQEFAANNALVDSVAPIDPFSFNVYWRGDPNPEMIKTSPIHNTPPTPGAGQRSIASTILGDLRRGNWIFIRNGGGATTSIPPQEIPRYRDEIAALKAGKPITQSIFVDKTMADHIQHPPVSLDQLREQGGP